MVSLFGRRMGAVAACTGGIAYLAHDTDSALARTLRLAYNATMVSCDYKFGPASKLLSGTDEHKAAMAETHQRSAERMLKVCLLHGGLYVKLGQFVASMNFVLPPAYPTVMAACQDRANAIGFASIRTAVESELRCKLEECFESFDPEPVAAASLAQVHRAVTREGQRAVAVKVQYPQLPLQMEADMFAMRVLAYLTSLLFPEHEYQWLLPEFETSMRAELDFRREASNALRTKLAFADDPRVYVPEVLPELTTSRVLTMEWIDGIKINDAERIRTTLGLAPAELAFLVCEVFSAMIFDQGFVHCDPHPGNMLARRLPEPSGSSSPHGTRGRMWRRRRPRAQLVVLDHGMYRELTESFRASYSRLWVSLLTADHERGRAEAVALGVPEEDYDALSLVLTFRPARSTAAIGARLSAEDRQTLRTRYGKVGAADVNAFLERLPRDMLFVMRTWSLVRSLNRELGGTTRERLLIISEHAAAGALRADDLKEADQEPMRDSLAAASRRRRHSFRGAVQQRWARLRMRFVVRLIDYMGAAALAAVGAFHALHGFVTRLTTRADGPATGLVANPLLGAQSEAVVREVLPQPKAKVLREVG